MQNKIMKNEYCLLPIPAECLEEAGIKPYAVIQLSVDGGKLIMESADTENYECDGNCEDCPLYDEDTDECCADDDTDEESDDTDYIRDDTPVTLSEFLDCLSDSEQKEALRYLSAKLTKMKGRDNRG